VEIRVPKCHSSLARVSKPVICRGGTLTFRKTVGKEVGRYPSSQFFRHSVFGIPLAKTASVRPWPWRAEHNSPVPVIPVPKLTGELPPPQPGIRCQQPCGHTHWGYL